MASDETTAASVDVNLPTGMREVLLHAPARRLADAVNQRNLEQGDREIAFGRYRLLRTLGRGGMGVVFEARDSVLGRRVALKLLSLPADRAAELALKEARSLGRLAHANVVHVYDVGEIDGIFYLAMELVDGQDLRQWLTTAQPDASELVEVYLAAGRGLAAAHAVGIVHCDFKPANVLLAKDGRILVVDFGIAAWLDDDEQSDQTIDEAEGNAFAVVDGVTQATRRIYGTRGYIPPERLERGIVDPRGDQYSFCVALLESLRKSGAVDATTSSRLRSVLARGLAHAPEDRFADMDELLAQLRKAHRGPSSAKPWQRPERALGLVTGLAIAALAVGIANTPPPERRAEQPAQTTDSSAPLDYSWQERECRLLDEFIADLRSQPRTAAEVSWETSTLLDFSEAGECRKEFLCPRVATLYWLTLAEMWRRFEQTPNMDAVDLEANGKDLFALEIQLAMIVWACKTPDDELLSDCLTIPVVEYEDAMCAAGYLADERCTQRRLHRRARDTWRVKPRGKDEAAWTDAYPRMSSEDPGGVPEQCAEALARFHALTNTAPL